MAENILELWKGGSIGMESMPETGDRVIRDATDSEISIEWPSSRKAMGAITPFYVCAASIQKSGFGISDRRFAVSLSDLPNDLSPYSHLCLSFAIILYRNGTPVDISSRIEVSMDNSYAVSAFVANPGKSIFTSLPLSQIAKGVPTGLYFTVRDVPDDASFYAAFNNLYLTDTKPETRETSFNQEEWIARYVTSTDSTRMDIENGTHATVTHPKTEPVFYDNGNIDTSPIGFPEVNNSGAANTGECDTDTPNPVFVSQAFSTSYGTIVQPKELSTVFIDALETLSGDPTLKVDSIDAELGSFMITILGNVKDPLECADFSLEFVATSGDTMEGTGIIGALGGIGDIVYDADGDCTTFTTDIPEGCSVTHVGPGKIGIALVPQEGTETYIALSGQDTASENGVYMLGSENGKWMKVENTVYDLDDDGNPVQRTVPIPDMDDPDVYPYADSTSYDNVWACDGTRAVPHFRKGYSDAEVHGFVDTAASHIYDNAMKLPSGLSESDGAFVKWLTGNGAATFSNISGKSLTVATFDSSRNSFVATTDSGEDDTALHTAMEWGIGTRHNSVDPETGDTTLPMDWPFNEVGGNPFATEISNNSITLLRKGADAEHSYGNLDYTNLDGDAVTVDKHSITIYNELKSNDSSNENMPGGYKDGSTVVKPTFIHIPAPLSTKDGDRVELEISLENVDADTAFSSGTVADLSGYYALMSQPRVFVCGGFQEMCSDRYGFASISKSGETVRAMTLSTVLTDSGDPLVHMIDDETLEGDNNGTLEDLVATDSEDILITSRGSGHGDLSDIRVPVKIHLMSDTLEPHDIWVDGVAKAESGVSDERKARTIFEIEEGFPYDPASARTVGNIYLCGVTFVRSNAEIDPFNPTDTDCGLVTRTQELLETDYGQGNPGELDEFNKFFKLNGTNDDGRTPFPGADKRYLLATMYQGATNTFGWKINGRKKLSSLEKAMTMCAELGPESIAYRTWETNLSALHHSDAHRNFNQYTASGCDVTDPYCGVGTGTIFNATESPLSYFMFTDGSGNQVPDESIPDTYGSAIAAKLRVKLPDTLPTESANNFVTDSEGNPVRQAARAYANLIADFKKSRLVIGMVQPSGNGSQLSVSQDMLQSFPDDDAFEPTQSSIVTNDDSENAFPLDGVGDEMWTMKLRYIPSYMRDALYNVDYSSVSTDWEGFDRRFREYFKFSNYCGDDPFASSGATEEVDCSVTGTTPYGEIASRFSDRSFVTGLSDKVPKNILMDIRRFSETQTIELDESFRNISNPIDGYYYPQHEEIFSSFAKVFSLDGVPAPVVTANTADTLSNAQAEFISADAVRAYGKATGDLGDFISGTMHSESGSEALAKFVETYLPLSASGMPKRLYSSTRVFLQDWACADSRVYRKHLWESELLDGCDGGELMRRYVNDNFASDSGSLNDPNLDWLSIDTSEVVTSLSTPPYSVTPEFVETFYDGAESTYTRVFMEFTFSEKAGRWFTTGYRQYPSNFLTPLYGAKALSAKLGSTITLDGTPANLTFTTDNGRVVSATSSAEVPIWAGSTCNGIADTSSGSASLPVGMIAPMDIRLGCVPFLYNEFPYTYERAIKRCLADKDIAGKIRMSRLEKPYLPVSEGGIGLFPPCDVHGDEKPETRSGEHANIWSVRKYIRPATGALPGADVPSVDDYTGGTPGDATLYSMFEYPMKGARMNKMPPAMDNPPEENGPNLLYMDSSSTGILTQGNGGNIQHNG